MAKTHAFGTTFSWGGAVVGGLDNIGGVEINVALQKVTSHDSPDAFEEYIAGLLDVGEVPISGYFDPADATGQQAMLTSAQARTSGACVITFPASTKATWTFTGLISNIKIGDSPVDGALPFSASIKPTGKPVFTITA